MKKFLINLFLVAIFLIGFTFIMDANSALIQKAQAEQSIASNADIKSAKAQVQGAVAVEFDPSSNQSIINTGILHDNWGILTLGLLAFLEVVVRVTPTEKDNTILSFVSKLLNAVIPNRRKAGGVH